MNREIDVRRRQSLLDISIQQTGSMEEIFDIVHDNSKSISDDLIVGEDIIANNLTVKSIADYFRINDIRPATAITMEEINAIVGRLEGVDYWIVERDFVVTLDH